MILIKLKSSMSIITNSVIYLIFLLLFTDFVAGFALDAYRKNQRGATDFTLLDPKAMDELAVVQGDADLNLYRWYSNKPNYRGSHVQTDQSCFRIDADALTNEETRGKLIETTELLQKFANETVMAIVTTLQENKQLLEYTMENFRPIIREFIVTIVSAVIQGLMVAIAASGPVGAPANLWFQGSKVVNEVAPKLGQFAENVSNIIDKYDKMLASLSEKGEGPLQRFKEIKEKITGFTDMISSVQQDAALINAMGKNV